jgi:sialate O-acetylesterase
MKSSFFVVLIMCGVITTSCNSNRVEQKVPFGVASVFDDSMVLQQESEVAIWGFAKPGEQVSIIPSWGESTHTMTDKNGNWIAYIKTPSAGVGHDIKFSSGSDTLHIHDVAIGEVWLASGQSNMEMPLSGWPGNPIQDSETEITQSDNPHIRIIMVQRAVSDTPQHSVSGKWEKASPETSPNFSATAYFFAKHLYAELGVPIGIIHSSWGGTAVDSWIPVEELEQIDGYKSIGRQLSSADTLTQNTPTVLYNAMIHPLIPYTFKGFLWYQGESDTGNPSAYKEKFTTMIRTWRERWNQDHAPFYYVQIAPYQYGEETKSQLLREAQFETLTEPNTGMVVTLDIGDPENIHPANKQEVGRRLALWAAGHAYNRDIVYSGPLFKSMEVAGNEIHIEFDHTAQGLVSGPSGVQNVQIAGLDKVFYPATAIIQASRLTVSNPNVANPVAVRYSWDNTSPATLFNSAGLPASSFRTDDWD